MHIPRRRYLDELMRNSDSDKVKMLVGMRGCGKTTLMHDVIDALHANGVPAENTIYLDLESPETTMVESAQGLVSYVSGLAPQTGRVYVFVDESRHLPGVPLAVDILRSSPRYSVFAASSSIGLFSIDAPMQLGKSYLTIEVMPLSFAAYASAAGVPEDRDGRNAALMRYLRYGGYPGLAVLTGDDVMLSYFRKTCELSLANDVAPVISSRNESLMSGVMNALMEDVGMPMSTNRLHGQLSAQGLAASPDRLVTISEALCNSFAFHCIRRYDMLHHQFLPTRERFYVGSTGLRTAYLGFRPDDMSRLVDNAVCLELLRRGRSVGRGKRYDQEISFITRDAMGDPVCCQTCVGVPTQQQLKPLRAMPSSTRKVLITFEAPLDLALGDGIEQLDIVDWLLEQDA